MSGKSTGWDETQFYSQLTQALWANNCPDIQQIVSHFIDEVHSCLKGEATYFSSINIAELVSGCFRIDKENPLKNHLHQYSYLSEVQNWTLYIRSLLRQCKLRSNVPFHWDLVLITHSLIVGWNLVTYAKRGGYVVASVCRSVSLSVSLLPK